MAEDLKYAVEMRDVTKRFGDVLANDSITLAVESGSIHAIIGENGAGKSTAMNILYGFYSADSGEILIAGQPRSIENPGDAIRLGLGMVHQHFMLVEPLTVAEKGLEQVWQVQKRLPWVRKDAPADARGTGLRAVVLGAGPIGILGAMLLVRHGFKTYVYSRSKKPNPKAELVESFGATYISSESATVDELADRIG